MSSPWDVSLLSLARSNFSTTLWTHVKQQNQQPKPHKCKEVIATQTAVMTLVMAGYAMTTGMPEPLPLHPTQEGPTAVLTFLTLWVSSFSTAFPGLSA